MILFLLFAVVCDANNSHCKITSGGTYPTLEACQQAKQLLPLDVTDSQCKRIKP